uniref:Uncharacterized protein n=1 Tax=Gossypium raimondii TaxID=29730 RepID=A0A0D2R9P7_GOSRA|nr:hypothetical protein B456_010G181200 [Gossypium raimondii]
MIPTIQADCSIPKHLKSKTLQQPVRVSSHQSASIIYWNVFFQKPLRLFRILTLLYLKRPKNSSSNYFLPIFQNGEPISDVAYTMWLSSIYFNNIECIGNNIAHKISCFISFKTLCSQSISSIVYMILYMVENTVLENHT